MTRARLQKSASHLLAGLLFLAACAPLAACDLRKPSAQKRSLAEKPRVPVEPRLSTRTVESLRALASGVAVIGAQPDPGPAAPDAASTPVAGPQDAGTTPQQDTAPQDTAIAAPEAAQPAPDTPDAAEAPRAAKADEPGARATEPVDTDGKDPKAAASDPAKGDKTAKADHAEKGHKGDKADKADKGDKGPKGDKGDKGEEPRGREVHGEDPGVTSEGGDPAKAEELEAQGKTKLSEGEYGDAIALFRASLKIKSRASVWEKLGEAYANDSQFDAAIGALKKAGDRPRAMLLLAAIYQQRDKPALARKLYERFLDKHPNHDGADKARRALERL